MNENKANNLPKTISKPAWWRSKWFIAAGLVIVIIAALIMTLAASKTSAPAQSKTLSTFVARRDNLTVTVTESGSIKARKSIDLKSEVEGRATIINIVPEGSLSPPKTSATAKSSSSLIRATSKNSSPSDKSISPAPKQATHRQKSPTTYRSNKTKATSRRRSSKSNSP